MTSELNTFLVQIQAAIDEAVSSSTRIGDIAAEMKRAGFDLYLDIESTVSIRPTDDRQRDPAPEPRLAKNGELTPTAADLDFLKDLKVSLN